MNPPIFRRDSEKSEVGGSIRADHFDVSQITMAWLAIPDQAPKRTWKAQAIYRQ